MFSFNVANVGLLRTTVYQLPRFILQIVGLLCISNDTGNAACTDKLGWTTGVWHTSGGGATSKLRWRHLQLQVAPLLSSRGATSNFRWRHLQLQVAPLLSSCGATSNFRWRHLQLQVAPLLSSGGATSKLQVAELSLQVAVLKLQMAELKFTCTASWKLKLQLRFEFVDLFINLQG